MKKIFFFLPLIIISAFVNSQTIPNKTSFTDKISLTIGQNIIVQSTISMEASLSMGMEVSNNTSSENSLVVKSSTDKNYTISSTLTKLKLNLNMMGQAASFDSEKKEGQDSVLAKSFSDKLNNPKDILIDNLTGKILSEIKQEKKNDIDQSNPMQGIFQSLGENDDVAIVSGAFELIPAGKNVGDSWTDSTVEKNMKVVRVYTLKSINNKEAFIQLNTTIESDNTFEAQGMEMEFISTTKTSSEIITDIETGRVKKKTTQADITGSLQTMGQSIPLTAKASSSNIYN